MGLKNNVFVKLKGGDRLTLRNGDVLSYDEYYDKITNSEDSRVNYKEDLTHKSRRELDIVEVKRPIEYTTVFSEEDRDTDNFSEEEIEEIVENLRTQLATTKKSDSEIIIRL